MKQEVAQNKRTGKPFMSVGPEKKPFIVLYDGVCNLCSTSVQFILKRDKKHQFVFGSLQGETGEKYLRRYSRSIDDYSSFMLVEGSKLYTRSTGALRMLKHLGGGWQLMYAFIIVPKFIRDAIYNFIARNRYKWFGKKNRCWVPTPELKSRFLD
jgi:predicted DCC family thiol-disulfide oxidoreductase YuxK